MKTFTIILVLLIGFIFGLVAPVIQAEWTPGENQIFFEKVARAAEMLNNAHRLSQNLADIADDEDIANSAEFVDVPPWVKSELIAMKTLFDDFHIFMKGGGVLPDENRGAKINAMLLGLQ